MDRVTELESIRIAARRGAAFARLVGPVVAQAIPPITIEQGIPAGDLEALKDNFGEITPAMIAAYLGAFEGAS